ncbi:unnamed protein product [Rotaria socialis]|uniref:Uncharacterized protein n=1 Tax=Rotaria socialis TaxID=392032 RepID=A0A820JS24_9BILA|nr:unnamed protein product [Rotaria socialis]CAF4451407.1 unnamed protein product [Rotaria socialis]CAF4669042.1 unnamed protein product [Rotaria socialis]
MTLFLIKILIDTVIYWLKSRVNFPPERYLIVSEVKFDIGRSDVVQEYDRDLGAINKLTFVDRIRRIISLFDEKRICICKW